MTIINNMEAIFKNMPALSITYQYVEVNLEPHKTPTNTATLRPREPSYYDYSISSRAERSIVCHRSRIRIGYWSATALSMERLAHSFPTFIVGWSRVHLPGAREELGEWCNVAPAGLDQSQETDSGNPYIDAPAAGVWFNDYVKVLVENTHLDIEPAAPSYRRYI
ncbi:hypothetical protein S7711_01299 [Stachybotrys chartarum IBT 7711]|uniref:Uncharacterized protein n=1 Tax=Stachybotrys chartarum (strain CBS 109288 / IBT 7711) TaxID=1280523 RepID=A0A084BBM1_STACB|nr:hypothetical protein S7711_01299 [Stachybotrys chartarum IBT 7711]